MNDDDRKICEAATPREWYWDANPKTKRIDLRSRYGIGDIVIDFVRYGMQGAAPRFNDCRVSDVNSGVGIMKRADEYFEVIPGREHHARWAANINHPDAQFIAHFNPAKVAALLDEIADLKKRVNLLETSSEAAEKSLKEIKI